MTIEDYKQKFLELFKQLEADHGNVREVEIGKDEAIWGVARIVIRITF